MYPFYNRANRNLHTDDVLAIWNLHGVAIYISGSNSLCSESTYSIQKLPPKATIQWSISNKDLVSVASSNEGVVLTRTTNGVPSGEILLTAVINIDEASFTVSKNITIGTKSPYMGAKFSEDGYRANQPIEGTYNEVYGEKIYISLTGSPNEFFWDNFYSSGNVTWYHPVGRDGLVFTFNNPVSYGAYFGFTVNRKGECGTVSEPFFFHYLGNNSAYYDIYPNLATSNITISRKHNSISLYRSQSKKDISFDQIVITDITGKIKMKQDIRSINRLQINVRSLTNGIYNLNLYYKGKLVEKKTIQIAR